METTFPLSKMVQFVSVLIYNLSFEIIGKEFTREV